MELAIHRLVEEPHSVRGASRNRARWVADDVEMLALRLEGRENEHLFAWLVEVIQKLFARHRARRNRRMRLEPAGLDGFYLSRHALQLLRRKRELRRFRDSHDGSFTGADMFVGAAKLTLNFVGDHGAARRADALDHRCRGAFRVDAETAGAEKGAPRGLISLTGSPFERVEVSEEHFEGAGPARLGIWILSIAEGWVVILKEVG